MKGRFIKILILLAIIAGAGLAWHFLAGNNGGEYYFRTTGTVEATEYDIASKIPGRLAEVRFHEGDTVKTGETVAVISSETLEADFERAKSAVDSARAVAKNSGDGVAQAKTALDTAKADVTGASSRVELAKASLDLAKKDHVRAEELFKKGVISKSDMDQAQTALDTATANLDSANAALTASKSGVASAEAAVKSARSALGASQARVAEAESAVKVAQANLEDAVILSPADALVEYRALEPGEVVAPGTPIMTLVSPTDKWVRIDVDERYIHGIKQGTKATVTLEYAPDKSIPATVYDIGREADFATERDVTRGRQDIRTFRVRLRFDDPAGVLKSGMTVIVTFG